MAIFVASIGLLALLAIFPVGALAMRQALKDSRCAQVSANATALYLAKVGIDGSVTNAIQGLPSNNYPLYVDPIGIQGGLGNLAGVTTSPISRTGVSFVNTPKLCVQWFTLLDDITFPQDDTTTFSSTLYAGLPCATQFWGTRATRAIPSRT